MTTNHHQVTINNTRNHQNGPTVGPVLDRSRSTTSLSAQGGRRRSRSRSRSRSSSRSTRHADEEHRPNSRMARDLSMAQHDAEPLLETDAEMIPKVHPPMADPEPTDDEQDEGRLPNTPDVHPGVDGGFFNVNVDDIFDPNFGTRLGEDGGGTELDGLNPNQVGKPQPGRGVQNFPASPGFDTGFNGVQIIPDVNVYQQKKTLAQGMMDLALLSANANQLRYVLESYTNHPYYHVSLVFIAMSIILQIGVGVGLIWNSRYNVKNEVDICKADRINNFTVMGIFMITTVNVFITSFGVASRDGPRPG